MWVFAVLGYTQAWRTRRRLFHAFFQRNAIPEYRPVHLGQCRRFLQRLLYTPEDFMALARQYVPSSLRVSCT